MTPIDFLDCIRVAAAFLAVFSGIPWLLLRIRGDEQSIIRFWAVAVQTATFGTSAAVCLGAIGLCLPGSMVTAYLLAFTATAHNAGLLVSLFRPGWAAMVLHRAIQAVESGAQAWRPGEQGAIASSDRWRICWHPALAFAGALALLGSIARLHYVRFLHDETYSRALSLQQLTLGQPWTHEGGVALLAPVAFLSSLDGAAVVRFCEPLLWGVLALVTFGVIRLTANSSRMGLLASGALVLFVTWFDSGEMRAGSISLIAWESALLFSWFQLRWEAFCSVALALLIEPLPPVSTFAGVALLVILRTAGRNPAVMRGLRPIGIPVAVGSFVWVMAVYLSWHEGDGPQYNAVARAVTRIKRETPRNTWLIVSPVQEVALTFGHGWHMELSEFIKKFDPDQVRRREFAFPFAVQVTIIIVEKQPLASRMMRANLSGFGPSFDPLVAPYLLRSQRDAMQFRAARIVEAYQSSHLGVDVLEEDANIVVYRVQDVSVTKGDPGKVHR